MDYTHTHVLSEMLSPSAGLCHYEKPMGMAVRKFLLPIGTIFCIFSILYIYNQYIEGSKSWREPVFFPASIAVTPEVRSVSEGNNVVLLLTYLRSGSTLTADIIQQASGVFYAYEPLKMFLPDRHYLMKNKQCDLVNDCVSHNSTDVMDAIRDFYNCKLGDLRKVFSRKRISSYAVSVFNVCYRDYKYNVSFCVDQVQRLCQMSNILSIKTIRISMDMTEELLKEIPTLKIIHLMRDPRGMLASRKRGGFLNKTEITKAAKAVCDRYMHDIKESRRLRQLYPGRIKTLLYEVIAEIPLKTARTIYKFLELEEPKNLRTWIYSHMSAGQKSTFYETIRPNSTETAYKWRRVWNITTVRQIDSVCGDVYRVLGLKKINNKYDLINYDESVRISSREFGYYFGKDMKDKH